MVTGYYNVVSIFHFPAVQDCTIVLPTIASPSTLVIVTGGSLRSSVSLPESLAAPARRQIEILASAPTFSQGCAPCA